jgi:Ca2+-transporting ATPase
MFFYKIDLDKARTMVATVAIFSEMFLVFACRSDKSVFKIGLFSNKFIVYSVLIAIALQLIAVYSPLSAVFGFKPLSVSELLISTIAASSAFVILEVSKLIKNDHINGFHRIHKSY